MSQTITSDLVEAYSLCPRKASLLITGESNPGPHEYTQVLEDQAAVNRLVRKKAYEESGELGLCATADVTTGAKVVADIEIEVEDLRMRCDFLTIVNEKSHLGKFSYAPVKVIGTCHVSRPDVTGLAYQGFVLGELQGRLPVSGTLIQNGDRFSKVTLASRYKDVRKIVATMRTWVRKPASEAPPVLLNKHCPICPFRISCLAQAEKEDNLSLLDRMTTKLIQKYHDKGIFTVRQLSHIYRPRRSKKVFI